MQILGLAGAGFGTALISTFSREKNIPARVSSDMYPTMS